MGLAGEEGVDHIGVQEHNGANKTHFQLLKL
ncbi:MAG: hypothetical protein ACJA08_002863 [Cyclobacteriaceae bacterium]|jgi:hypothetical protein